jgi:hypothetical protein
VRQSLALAPVADVSAIVSERQMRRMKRRGIEEGVTPLALKSRAIDLQSGNLVHQLP